MAVLVVRYKQSARSKRIEIIDLFLKQHRRFEFEYFNHFFKKMTQKKVIVDQPDALQSMQHVSTDSSLLTYTDFADLKKESEHTIFMLKDPVNIKKVVSAGLIDEIYLIRHEGDFVPGSREPECDCEFCIVDEITDSHAEYTLDHSSDIDFFKGIQYSYLKYRKADPKTARNHNVENPACLKNKLRNPDPVSALKEKKDLSQPDKAYHYYRQLGSPKYICAPMVDQSGLAFRMLVRKYGVQHCYAPMILSDELLINEDYRHEMLATNPRDRSLSIQLAADNPDNFVKAGLLVQDLCDYVDLNLGCPQPIARRHHYGAWLMEDWDLVYEILSSGVKHLNVPVTCKIRIFADVETTINYAKLVERAGVSLLAVHGRGRTANMNIEHADLEQIKQVKAAVKIPVVANGNIIKPDDCEKNLQLTGADAIMTADALLSNPLFFSNVKKNVRQVALEYLAYAHFYKSPLRYAIPHVMQIMASFLSDELIDIISDACSITELKCIVKICKLIKNDKYSATSNYDLLVGGQFNHKVSG